MSNTKRLALTDLQLDQIEDRRQQLGDEDVWFDGDECGNQIRADLDALIEEVKRLRKDRR